MLINHGVSNEVVFHEFYLKNILNTSVNHKHFVEIIISNFHGKSFKILCYDTLTIWYFKFPQKPKKIFLNNFSHPIQERYCKIINAF